MEADLVVEVLGTLCCLALPDFDYAALVARHGLLGFIAQLLGQHPDDDVLLELAILAGVLCTEETAPQFLEHDLVSRAKGHGPRATLLHGQLSMDRKFRFWGKVAVSWFRSLIKLFLPLEGPGYLLSC